MRYFSPAIPRSGPAAVCTSAGSEALAALTGHTPDIGQGTPETGQISGGEACGLQGTAGGADVAVNNLYHSFDVGGVHFAAYSTEHDFSAGSDQVPRTVHYCVFLSGAV